MEQRRNCGFREGGAEPRTAPVWVRGAAVATECPRSLVRAEQIGLVELFHMWKRFGTLPEQLNDDSRAIEAMIVLDEEWRKEQEHGQR